MLKKHHVACLLTMILPMMTMNANDSKPWLLVLAHHRPTLQSLMVHSIHPTMVVVHPYYQIEIELTSTYDCSSTLFVVVRRHHLHPVVWLLPTKLFVWLLLLSISPYLHDIFHVPVIPYLCVVVSLRRVLLAIFLPIYPKYPYFSYEDILHVCLVAWLD